MDNKILQEAEGKLLVHRWMNVFMSKTVFYYEDYYVVRNGKVLFIHTDLTERESGDNVETTFAECECLGEYDPSKIKREDFDYIPYEKIRNKFIKKQLA
ncbi:MAG: hypothetical protein V4538_14980 [Bacteroidota bacterium]